MAVPKTIFVEEQVYGGSDAEVADAMLEALQGGLGMDELTLAFLKEHEEQELKTSASSASLQDVSTKSNGKLSDSKRNRNKPNKASKLARKMLGL